MSTQIYCNKGYKIYKSASGFIVHNTRKPFKLGHTHIDSLSTAKYIIALAIHKSIPKHLSNYLWVSLIRITDDKNYKKQLYIKLSEGAEKNALQKE